MTQLLTSLKFPDGSYVGCIDNVRYGGGKREWEWSQPAPRRFPKNPKDKTDFPCISGRAVRGDYRLLCLDFDWKATGTLTTKPSDWNSIVAAALSEVPGILVIPSISGNVKAFLIACTGKGRPDLIDAACWSYALDLVPQVLRPYLDKQGLWKCFVNEGMWKALQEWIPAAELHTIVREERVSVNDNRAASASLAACTASSCFPILSACPTPAPAADSNIVSELPNDSGFRFFSYAGKLPAVAQRYVLSSRFGQQIRERLIRILLSAWNLNKTDGFQLPLKVLAVQLGTSVANVSTLIGELKRIKFLVCTDHSYVVGVRAKTYKATGAFREAIASLQEQHKSKKSLPRLTVAPQEGERYTVLLAHLWRFQEDVEAGLAWVRTLEGFTYGHEKIAKGILECQRRKLQRVA